MLLNICCRTDGRGVSCYHGPVFIYANMQDANRRAVLCIEHFICLGVMTCRGVLCIEHIICLAVMTVELHIICLGVLTVELYCVLSTLYVLVC